MSRVGWIVGFSLFHIASVLGAVCAADSGGRDDSTWYKGSTHSHSFWSDGDDFPEMVADWYKQHGYRFLALSDHNVLMRGQKWRDVYDKDRPIPESTIEKCRRRFGPAWVETRGEGKKLQVRLKTLAEIRAKLEEPGKFLLVENEEITGKSGHFEVHLNAINLAEFVPHQPAATVLETLQVNLRAVGEQAARLGRPIAAVVNHPSWPYYHITAEDLAETDARLFEVCNASPDSNRLGDALHPSTDRIWDITNTLRIAQWRRPPLHGVATDDAHDYQQFGPKRANPGRGFVMVRAGRLAPEAIAEAMLRGDFYASTGVILKQLAHDPAKGTLTVAVDPQPGANYTIDFLGTEAGYDRTTERMSIPDKDGKPQRPVTRYSKDVGKLLASVRGPLATYRFTGKELYVRVAIRSDQRMANPPEGEGQCQETWCQPVGWEKRIGK